MEKNSLNKVVFQNPKEHIEVFCPQKYKGYYVRGQITELSDDIYDESLSEGFGCAYYHVRLYALVSEKYFKEYDGFNYHPVWGMLVDRNAEDFFKKQRNYDLSLVKDLSENLNKSLEEITITKIHNSPITINISDIDFEDNDYLKNCIKSKKKNIILSIDIYLDRVESSKTKQIIAYPQRIHQLMAYHFTSATNREEDKVAEWFWNLFDMVYFNFDYDFTSRKEYQYILYEIGDLSLWLFIKRKITKRYLTLLNKFISTIGYGQYPVKDFCYQFFGNLLKELIENKKICQCGLCGDVFKFKVRKKYCSLANEGKDCGKKARNRRFYLKHRDIILPKARKTTKELRSFYKERGIKK